MKETSGYIYVLEDKSFPDYIKFGYTTDIPKKLRYFESNKPFKTCKVIYSSDKLGNMKKAYSHLWGELRFKEGFVSPPRKLAKGWYPIANKPLLEEVLMDWIKN